MENDGGMSQDRRSLLDLLERAALERDAASQLLVSGGSGQGPSAALHIFRAWHTLATVQARLVGDTDPDVQTFELATKSDVLAPVADKRLEVWPGSFARIREAALAEPWYGEAGELDPKDLRRQIQLLGTCISAQRRRVISHTVGGRGLWFGWRDVVITIAVAVLAIVVVDLGALTVRGMRARAERERDRQLLPAHQFAQLDELRDFKPRGSSWDGPGNVIIRDSLTIALGRTWHPDMVSISLDGNDQFILRFIAGENIVGMLSVGPSEVAGLEVYTLTVPENARVQGFDRIIIDVDVGDGSQSVGHVLLNEPTPPDEAAETQ